MAEQLQHHHELSKSEDVFGSPAAAVDRGLFDLSGKKEEEVKGDIAGEFDEKVKVGEDEVTKEEDELQRSSSSTSSSSEEEEVGEGGEKKKKKKASKEEGDDKPEEKKGFLDKIKEKLPGGKKAGEVASPPPTPVAAAEGTEKKGFLEKIKEKIGEEKTGKENEQN